MKLYGVPLSVHTRKVQLGLRTKGLDHQLRVVIPIAPDTLPENWKTLSPTGLIPVIEDGTFVLPDPSVSGHEVSRYAPFPRRPRAARSRHLV
jgi:glutathione S-transferase